MTDLTAAAADAIWREHGDRAWAHFRTNPVYRVMLPPEKPDISFRRRNVIARPQNREVVTIVHETEDMPMGAEVGWRVKVGPWIVAEGSKTRQTHEQLLRTAHL